MKRIFKWLTSKFSPSPPPARPDLGKTGAHLRQSGLLTPAQRAASSQAALKRQSEFVELDPHLKGEITDAGPGKNVLIRNKYRREDSGTHETLKILDDSLLDTEEETGIDPYNTGRFDRAKNWDKRFRK